MIRQTGIVIDAPGGADIQQVITEAIKLAAVVRGAVWIDWSWLTVKVQANSDPKKVFEAYERVCQSKSRSKWSQLVICPTDYD